MSEAGWHRDTRSERVFKAGVRLAHAVRHRHIGWRVRCGQAPISPPSAEEDWCCAAAGGLRSCRWRLRKIAFGLPRPESTFPETPFHNHYRKLPNFRIADHPGTIQKLALNQTVQVFLGRLVASVASDERGTATCAALRSGMRHRSPQEVRRAESLGSHYQPPPHRRAEWRRQSRVAP